MTVTVTVTLGVTVTVSVTDTVTVTVTVRYVTFFFDRNGTGTDNCLGPKVRPCRS